MAGEAAAGADQLDLEAAEQLIQLSGGDGGSESRSADSVKCCEADQADAKEKEKEVESRRTRSAGRFSAGRDGDGGEVQGSRSRAAGTEEKGKEEERAVESHRKRSAAARFLAGVVDDGGERRRPRFRWLTDLYRETRQVMTTPDPRAGGGNVHPESAERRKRKRVAEADKVVVAVVPEESKEGTMAA